MTPQRRSSHPVNSILTSRIAGTISTGATILSFLGLSLLGTSVASQESPRTPNTRAALLFRKFSADTNTCKPGKQAGRHAWLPHYEIRQLSPPQLAILRGLLRGRCFADAIGMLTSDNYQPQLLSWVVYIGKGDTVWQGLTTYDNIVHGMKYVWAMVFSDRPLIVKHSSGLTDHLAETVSVRKRGETIAVSVPPADNRTSDQSSAPDADLMFARRAIVYGPSADLSTLLSALGKVVGISAPAAPVLNDSSEALSLHLISSDTTDTLYVGFARFGLVDNAQAELSLAPANGKQFWNAKCANDSDQCALQSIYTNLANSKQPRIEAGVLFGVSYGGSVPAYNANLQVQSVSSRWQGNGYLVAIWNVAWSHSGIGFGAPSWQPFSFGIFGGTNFLTGGIGNELIYGVLLGHFIGDVGFALGDDSTPVQSIRRGQLHSQRQDRLLSGLVIGI